MKFALRPYHFIMIKAKSAASGKTSVTMMALRTSAEQNDENNKHENRAFLERLRDRVNRFFHESVRS